MLIKKGAFIMELEVKRGIYRHYKGGEYELLVVATHSETMEKMVVYRALYGAREFWVRPLSMWNETVQVNGVYMRRFTYVGPAGK
jgi:hypothetical protein